MSNAEMPPLQPGQVWDYGSDRATLGQYLAKEDEFRVRWREFGSRWEYASFLRNHLRVQRARLIHGPGAPWSPKDVQEPKADALAEAEESIACPGCGHDAFEHANDSRIVGCEWSDGVGTICGCRWLLWEILRYAANKRRVEKHGEPFDDKYHEKMGFRG